MLHLASFHRIHRIPGIAFAVLLALALAPAADAEDRRTKEHRGTIEAIDRRARTLTVATPQGPAEFALSPNARIYSRDREADIDVLAVGQTVTVRARDDDATEREVEFVQIADPAELVGQLEDWPAVDVADTATVVSVNPADGHIVVATPDGARRVRVDAATRVRRGAREIGVGDLAVSERVQLSGDRDGEELVARFITVVVDPPDAGAEAP